MQRVLGVPQDWVPPVCLFHYFKVCAVFLEKTKSSNEDSHSKDVLIHLESNQPPLLTFWKVH